MESDYQRIIDFIKSQCGLHGNPAKFARAIGCNQSRFSNLAKGKTGAPNLEALCGIMAALDVPLYEMIRAVVEGPDMEGIPSGVAVWLEETEGTASAPPALRDAVYYMARAGAFRQAITPQEISHIASDLARGALFPPNKK